ncbi:MAG: polysaccharide deacetylase family protein [Verrucomicrobiota bacterium]
MSTEFFWHYPEAIPLKQVQWLSRILRQNYGLFTRLQASPNKSHRLEHPKLPGQILIQDHREARSAKPKPWIPDIPIKSDHPLVEPSLPVIQGKFLSNHDYVIWEDASSVEIGVDIFSAIFTMLSREEEYKAKQRDRYHRYAAHYSRAYKESFLDRPIVDEYVEVLWAYIQKIWPLTERKRRTGTIRYSCDVDVPIDPASRSLKEFVTRFSADLVKRKSPRQAIDRCLNCVEVFKGHLGRDPNYKFQFIFDQIEQLPQPSVFYFLSTLKIGKGQGWYKITDSVIKKLLKRISDEGHVIGLHGSLGSFRDPSQLSQELQLLERVCSEVGISSTITHNRQHYLQFDIKSTPDILEANGITHDSSGGYADCAGFRFGTAIPFPMWSWSKKEGLGLIQQPLICMEASLLASQYMNLKHFPDAYEYANKLKTRALAFGGDFTLLWHNSHLKSMDDQRMLEALLS